MNANNQYGVKMNANNQYGVKMNAKSEYDLQAEKFLQDTCTTLAVKFLRNGKYFDGDKDNRNIYKFTLLNVNGFYSAEFGQSIVDSLKNIPPSAYKILACLQANEPETVDELLDSYGYEINSTADYKRLQSIAKALKKQNKGLRKLFTPAELELLAEIQ